MSRTSRAHRLPSQAPPTVESSIDALYRHRIPAELMQRRAAVWRVLCECWFARHVPENARVLDLAAGYCEFINHVRARDKHAVDLNPETRRHAGADVRVHEVPAEDLLTSVAAESVDIVFTSNFLEHCRTRDHLLQVLRAARAVLKPGGRILVMGPNYRFCAREYFDFFDHYLPLSERSVAEALSLAGFSVQQVVPRWLPYSFRQRLPSWPWLVRLYLRFPPAWRLLGKQFFIVARRADGPAASLQPKVALWRPTT